MKHDCLDAECNYSRDDPRPEPESDTLGISTTKALGSVRKDREETSPAILEIIKATTMGLIPQGTNRTPRTSNFVEFLSMYGQFAGEDLEEDSEVLSPNEYTQSDVTTLQGSIGEEYGQTLGSPKYHSSAQKILNLVNESKQPLTLPEVKRALNTGHTVHNQEPDIPLDVAMPEMPTFRSPLL